MEGLKGCPFSPYWKPLVIISVVSALSSPSSLLPSLLIIFSLLKGNDDFGLLLKGQSENNGQISGATYEINR